MDAFISKNSFIIKEKNLFDDYNVLSIIIILKNTTLKWLNISISKRCQNNSWLYTVHTAHKPFTVKRCVMPL